MENKKKSTKKTERDNNQNQADLIKKESEDKPEVIEKVETDEAGFKCMRKFIDAIQSAKKVEAKNDKDELTLEYDFSKAFDLTQITWEKTTKQRGIALLALKENVLLGNVGVRLRKILSSNCTIMEISSNSGIYSAKVIKETAAYKPSSDGIWGVNPLSFHKL